MLNLNPGLMSSMDDSHLIAALGCEASLMRTPVEAELLRRLESVIDRQVDIDMIRTKCYEALCGYPDEDCLADITNRDDCPPEIAKLLNARELEIWQSVENGKAELDQILDHLENK